MGSGTNNPFWATLVQKTYKEVLSSGTDCHKQDLVLTRIISENGILSSNTIYLLGAGDLATHFRSRELQNTYKFVTIEHWLILSEIRPCYSQNCQVNPVNSSGYNWMNKQMNEWMNEWMNSFFILFMFITYKNKLQIIWKL